MTLRELLDRIPKSVALIDVAVAALSATLIRSRLVPENVDAIATAGALLVFGALFLTVAYADSLRRRLGALAWGTIGALVFLLLLHLLFVVEVPVFGPDEGTHRFLVGFHYTSRGEAWINRLASGSPAQFIRDIGPERIPVAWGWSYFAVAVAYVFSYLTFVLGGVLALGAAIGSEPPPRGKL